MWNCSVSNHFPNMICSNVPEFGQFTMDYKNVQGLYYLVSPKMQRHRKLSNFGQNLSTSLTSLNILPDNNNDSILGKLTTFLAKYFIES